MIVIEDLGGIQDLEPRQLTKIIGGGTGETEIPGSVLYKPIGFPTCPLYQFPDGTIGHLCPGEPKPKPPVDR